MRRLARGLLTSQWLLGIGEDSVIERLLPAALDLCAGEHPQLAAAGEVLRDSLAGEQARFQWTLKRGQRRLDRLLERRKYGHISGEEMVRFEKKDGIPVSLLKAMLRQRQIHYSWEAYQAAFRQWQRAIAGTA